MSKKFKREIKIFATVATGLWKLTATLRYDQNDDVNTLSLDPPGLVPEVAMSDDVQAEGVNISGKCKSSVCVSVAVTPPPLFIIIYTFICEKRRKRT